MKKNILAIQIHADLENKKKNFEKVEKILDCNSKKIHKGDILFLPEVWTTSWNPDEFLNSAEDENGETVSFLKKIASNYSINVIGGSFIRKTKGIFKNSCPIIDKKGNLFDFYDKIHLFAFDKESELLQSGEKPVVLDIEGLKIGLSICYDIRFPELFRSMALKHRPHLLVNLSAWPEARINEYEILASARALENQACFLGLTLSGKLIKDFNFAGKSFFYSQEGKKIAQLDIEDGLLFVEIDTNIVDKTRKIMSHLDMAKKTAFAPCEIIKIEE